MWGGRPRRAWQAAFAGAALLPVAAVGIPLFVGGSEPGASSPEALVDDVVAAVNDQDFARVAALIDPETTDELEGAVDSFSRTSEGVLTPTSEAFAEETADLSGVFAGPDPDRAAVLAIINATVLEIDDVDISVDEQGERAEITVERAVVDIEIDGERISQGRRHHLEGTSGADAQIDVGEVVTIEGEPVALVLVAVERDGRWYLSLPETVDGFAERADQ